MTLRFERFCAQSVLLAALSAALSTRSIPKLGDRNVEVGKLALAELREAPSGASVGLDLRARLVARTIRYPRLAPAVCQVDRDKCGPEIMNANRLP
jgi:hypothetical protein